MIKKGRGIAATWYGTGYGNGFPDVSVATIELLKNGDVAFRVGAAEVGQGSKTAMPQIGAEVLRMNIDNVVMICEDTREFQDSGTAAASRQTYNTGNALKLACESFKKEMYKEAVAIMELNAPVGLEMEDQEIFLAMLPDKRTTFKAVAEKIHGEGRELIVSESFTAQTTHIDSETGQGAPYWPYTFDCYGVELEVDTGTGRVYVTRAICAQDVGRAINPELCEGQIEGGFVMGQGYALFEELGLKNGEIKNNKFAKYIIPTAMDIPKIESILIEDPEPTAPYGAKGIGEPVMVAVAPAILNAIYDAIGIRITKLPASPDVILAALAAK